MLPRMRISRPRSPFASPYLLTGAIAAGSLLTACGGAAPPPPQTGAVAVAKTAEAPPPPPELAPAEEPKSLLVVARWKGPVRTAEHALQALGVPIPLGDMFVKEAGSDAKNIDLDGSVDFAMSLDPASTDKEPKVFFAVSFPLHSFEAQVAHEKQEGKDAIALRPGVVRLVKGAVQECEIWHAPNAPDSSPARLVCGQGVHDLDALGDWLERGLGPTPAATDDMVVTVRARPLKDRYLTPLRTQATTLAEQARIGLTSQNVTDPDLVAAPGILLDEGIQFLQDIDGMEMHISLAAAPPQLAVGGSLRFGARNAWLTRVMVDINDKAGPPPAMFWQVPRDSYSASWGRRSDPRLFEGVNRTLHKALTLVLERVPLPPADKEAITAFLTATPTTSPTWVSAQGILHGGKKHPHSAKPTPAESLADVRDLATGALGWHVIGVETPAAEYVTWLKSGVNLYNRAVKLGRSLVPSKATDEQKHLLTYIPKLTAVTALPGWPKGTVSFDLQLAYDSDLAALLNSKKDEPASGPVGVLKGKKAAKPPPAKGTLTLRLAVVPDGDHTWMGLSTDLDELKKRVGSVLSTAPREGTLAARDGLEALKQPGQTWGGFFSMGTLVDRAREEMEQKDPTHAADVRAALAAMPNHWQTPILLVGSGATGPTPSIGGELRFQTGTLADVAGLVKFLTSDQGKALLKKLDKP